MKIEGYFSFPDIAPQTVWNFLTDPARIAECLPGCERLTKVEAETYEMRIRVGIGAIRGTYTGTIRLHDLTPPSEYRMAVTGNGTGGFMNGAGTVRLTASTGGTLLEYAGELEVGGPIAAVGQRMVGGAARMVSDQFFRCVAGKLNPPA